MKAKNLKSIIIYLGILIIGVSIGWLLSQKGETIEINEEAQNEHHQHTEEWTCSMHPSVRTKKFGKCPICAMDLIKVGQPSNNNKTSNGENKNQIKLSKQQMELANIETMIIQNFKGLNEMILDGEIVINESEVIKQTTHIAGRLDQLIINTNGEYVKSGQIIARIYSPLLVTAQQELLEAYKIKDKNPELFLAAKGKLKNWKLKDSAIDQIISSNVIISNFPITADKNGFVSNMRVKEGDHLMEGTVLFEIANLSKVWVELDIYERDIANIQIGSKVQFNVNGINNKTYKGKISFIDPILDSEKRVNKARVVINNNDNMLKPGMFVTATVETRTKDSNKADQKLGVVIPRSAILWTGKKSLVYVKSSEGALTGFVLRQVVLGKRLGDHQEVLKGLWMGEEIAVNGVFSIDAAAQLAGKPSMMNLK